MHQVFETLRDELEQALGGLDATQTQLRTHGDLARWSIQQTIEHLLLTYAATEQAFDARLTKGTPTRAKPSILQRVGQAVIIRGGFFPPRRKAPEIVCPVQEAEAPSGILVARVGVALKSLDLRMAAVEKAFGTRRRAISHLFLGPMSVDQWRKFQLIHGRHHMKFIAKVRREFGV